MILSILALAWLLSIPFAETFNLLENPKDIHSIAFSGGGFAEMEGANALLNNPAGLEIQSGSHLGISLSDFSQGLYPWIYYGQRVSPLTCYALGLFSHRTMTERLLQRGVLAGFSLSAMPRLILGGVVYSQTVLKGDIEGFGIDINVGSIYKWDGLFWAALALKNINRSRLGNNKLVYKPDRIMAAALKFFPEKTIHLYLDYIVPNFSFSKAAPIISGRTLLGDDGNMGITASLRWDHRTNRRVSLGGGMTLASRISKHHFRLEYSLSGIPLSKGNPDIFQAVSLNWHLSYFRDRFPPLASVREEMGYLSFASPKGPNDMVFKLLAEDRESYVKTWHLVICNINDKGDVGSVLRSFSGNGLPPKFIRWDGRDSYKNLLAMGLYTYRFLVTDAAGNVTKTQWRMFEVKN